MTAITLLTQEDCAYCEHARRVLARVGKDHPLEVTEIDITSRPGQMLAARAGVVFAPGLLVGGRPFGYGRISERRLRRTLQRLAVGPERNRRLPKCTSCCTCSPRWAARPAWEP